MQTKLEIKKVSGSWAVFAGKSRLSKTFRSEIEAAAELYDRPGFYSFWAGSASVSVIEKS